MTVTRPRRKTQQQSPPGGNYMTTNPRSGELVELSDYDIDRYMKGDLA